MHRHLAPGGARRADRTGRGTGPARSGQQVKNHPRFKYFREAGEDAYQSFLGVPLIDRGVLQGVLVVQTIEAARLSAKTKFAC